MADLKPTGQASCASHLDRTWASNSSDICSNGNASPTTNASYLTDIDASMAGDAESPRADAITGQGAGLPSRLPGATPEPAKRLVAFIRNAIASPTERADAMNELILLCDKGKRVHVVIEADGVIGSIVEALDSQALVLQLAAARLTRAIAAKSRSIDRKLVEAGVVPKLVALFDRRNEVSTLAMITLNKLMTEQSSLAVRAAVKAKAFSALSGVIKGWAAGRIPLDAADVAVGVLHSLSGHVENDTCHSFMRQGVVPALVKLLQTKSRNDLTSDDAASLANSMLMGMLEGPRSSACREHLVQSGGVRAVVDYLRKRMGVQASILVSRLSSVKLSAFQEKQYSVHDASGWASVWKQFAAAGGADLLVSVIRDDPGSEEADGASRALGVMCTFDLVYWKVVKAAGGDSALREVVVAGRGNSAGGAKAALRRCGVASEGNE